MRWTRIPSVPAAASLLVAFLLAGAPRDGAADEPSPIVTETVEYRHGDVVCEGFLAYDRSKEGKRPGVLVFHAWKGPGEHERESARKLAAMGYVAFCADVYGQGVRPADAAAAGKESGKYKGDRALARARATAALETLRKDPRLGDSRVGAIGYCFGGMVALELARSGADVAAVVSFHGALDSPAPEDGRKIRAKVLALHGGDDPWVPAKDVAAWMEEMRGGGVDWTFTAYGGAVHSFTDPDAGSDPKTGAAYHPAAAARSWKAMDAFFQENLRGE